MTRITLGERTLEIEGADADEVCRMIETLKQFTQTAPSLVQPKPDTVREVIETIEAATGLQVVETTAEKAFSPPPVEPAEPAISVPEHPPGVPARRAPRVESDPEVRERQRQAMLDVAARHHAQRDGGVGDAGGHRAVVAVVVSFVGACSLFTNLDGLGSGDSSVPTDAASDQTSDAPTTSANTSCRTASQVACA